MKLWQQKFLLKNNLLYSLAVLLLPLGFYAQGFKSYFNPQFTPKSTCSSKFITETTPGNYVSLGITTDSIYGIFYNKLVVTGINSQGATLWSKYYGSINGFAYDLDAMTRQAIYHQGNIYFTSWVGVGGPAANGTLMKIDPNGNLVWQKIYQEPNCKTGTHMLSTSVDGGFLICGTSERSIQQDAPALLIKTDSNGNELWRKKYSKASGKNFLLARSVKQDPVSKRIVITGQCCAADCNTFNPFIIITDSLGTEIEQRIFNNLPGYFTDLTQLGDGSFVAVGGYWTDSLNVSQARKLMLSLHVRFYCTVQAPIFVKYYDRLSVNNSFCTVNSVGDGSAYLTAGTLDTLYQYWPPYKYNEMLRLTIFDTSGTMIKNSLHAFNNLADKNREYFENLMYCTSEEPTSDGGLVVAMRVNNWTISNPIFNVKFDANGCDSTVEYCKNPLSLEDISDVQLKSIFPNPANDKLHIDFENTSVKSVLLVSAQGLQVYKSEGTASGSIDLSQIANGVYTLRVIFDDNSVTTKKVVVQH